ncbi:CHAT domain-containing protein [candidate division WOR-3 bacterium]|uniref:CHAT domain-containing protein n=1 Tax=candidate division WOR-3 bacterium TaxID=2052148 RepID=A0A9D5KAK1_UNCW3|nr:CHAT domain-containing protein [candidate division WOR-3 bacterium]MBD3364669.1 CHAT domain-containing protein [candidate division WOR-3 bacterium]
MKPITLLVALSILTLTLLNAKNQDYDSYVIAGDSCFNIGCYQEAIDNYKEALDGVLRKLGTENTEVAAIYDKLGETYKTTGIYQDALDNYEQGLEIRRKVLGENNSLVAENHMNLGTFYFDLGDYNMALDHFSKAQDIKARLLGVNHPDVGWVYNLMGCVYLELKDSTSSRTYLDKAIATMGETNPNSASVYNNLGMNYKTFNQSQKADESFRQALNIYKTVLGKVPSSRSNILIMLYTYIGHVHFELEEYQQALAGYQKAMVLQVGLTGTKHLDVAEFYRCIGNVYAESGNHTESLTSYGKALDILIDILGQDNPKVGRVYSAMGSQAMEIGDRERALGYFEKSIKIFEQSRGRIESESLKASYTETVAERYEEIIDLLVKMDRVEEAFQYLERSKSKALKDALDERYEIDLGAGTLASKIEESKVLANKVDNLESQLNTEKQKPDSLRNQTKLENLSHQLQEAKTQYFKVAAQIQADPDYAFSVRVHPTEIGKLRDELPEGQKLVMIYSGEKELYLFCVHSQGYEVRSVPVRRDSLTVLINRCRYLCGARYAEYLARKGMLFGWSWSDDGTKFYKEEVAPLKSILLELYSYLIEPLENEFSTAEVITFIPSGQLYYLPWGALADVKDRNDEPVFLSERYNWHVMTSTELLDCIYRRADNKELLNTLALVGNPAGADPDLPSAEEEVSSIKAAYPSAVVLTGEDATESGVTSIIPNSQVLHLATHCRLNAESPWESYIHLAETDTTDGRWTVEEIYAQSWDRIQLVTLSACETAVGSDRPGLGLENMAKAFSIAMEGPPSIIATLWPVADESTKEFMVAFYEELKDNPKSEALRKAQAELINSEKYSHPFFWAPFILIGEWR